MNTEKIIGLLKPYFEQRADIVMASCATGAFCDVSDVDIAVLFKTTWRPAGMGGASLLKREGRRDFR